MISFWSPKGGSGVTVTAAIAAIAMAEKGVQTVVTGTDNDLVEVFGLDTSRCLRGLREWMRTGRSIPQQAVKRVLIPVADNLNVLPAGESAPTGPVDASRLSNLDAAVVADIGMQTTDDELAIAAKSTKAWLVMRPCFLTLRRAAASTARNDGVVLIDEAHRALARREIEDVLGVTVVASIPCEPRLAHAVDLGRLHMSKPRTRTWTGQLVDAIEKALAHRDG